MVPGEEIPREVGAQHQREEQQPDDPIESAGSVEGSGVKDPQQMQEGHQDQAVGGPEVDVSYEAPDGGVIPQALHRAIGPLSGRFVSEQEQRTRDSQKDEEHHGHPPEPARAGEL